MTQNNLERKEFIWLKFILQSSSFSQGKNLEAGTVAKTKEECRLLACFSWLLSYLTQPRIICPEIAEPSYIS